MNSFHIKTHYGCSLNPAYMTKWGRAMAKVIAEFAETNNKFPVLVYRGMSGCASANAIAMHLAETHDGEFGLCYVRKPNEKSHGSAIEYSDMNPSKPIQLIICDDFVSSGKTVLEILQTLAKRNSSPIPLDSVLLALSLGEDYWTAATRLTTFADSATFRHNWATTLMKCREKYAKFEEAEVIRIAEMRALQKKGEDEFLASLSA